MIQKEKLIPIVFILIYTLCFSQERIGEFTNDLKENLSFVKDVIPITNSKNNDLAVFIADSKNVYGYKLNDKFVVTSKITSEEKRRKYKTLLGYSIPNENNYKIFLTNTTKNKFLIVDFYFTKGNTITKEFVLENPSEKIVQTISLDNKFYLITAKPFSRHYDINTGIERPVFFHDDNLYFYSIDINNNVIKKRINLSKHQFINKKGERVKVRSLLTAAFESGTIPRIDESLANSISLTAKTVKLYVQKNKVIFTFDKNNEVTQILEINLDDFTTKKHTYLKNLTKAKRSNSFILDNEIIIASSNKKELLVEVFDKKSKDVIKQFNIHEDKEINFKNSPIIQKGGAYSDYRELKTTKQFLRKITADKFGLSLYKIENNYKLSIGGYSPIPQGGGGMMMGGFGGIPIAGVGGMTMFFNPTMFAYNASAGTKSTQIDCLLDLNFNHIKGEIPENTFDKIDTFLDQTRYRDDNNDIIEVFKHKQQTILGSYDKPSNKYYFYKF